MDEPLSNLDAKLRVQTRAEIARLHQRLKTTIVYVTHDQVEAMTMGTRIAVMSDGLLQQVGTPAVALRHPDQPVRRRVHRQPGDELRRPGPGRAPATARRSRARTSTCRSRSAFASRSGRRPGARSSPGSGRSTSISATAGPDAATIQVKADVVEYLGNEELLHVTAGAKELVAVVGAEHQRPAGRHRQPRRADGEAPPVRRRERAPRSASDGRRRDRGLTARRATTAGSTRGRPSTRSPTPRRRPSSTRRPSTRG